MRGVQPRRLPGRGLREPFIPVSGGRAIGIGASSLRRLLPRGRRSIVFLRQRATGFPVPTCRGVQYGWPHARRDGFASLTDQWPPGAPRLAAQGAPRITTRPIKFSGRHLFINAGIDGSIRVEVLDAAGRVIEPFTLEGCVPVSGDGTRLAVTWTGAPALSALAGQVVRLRFTLTRARLFAFWISPSASGESRGYVAAGGPGYTRPTDAN